MMNPVRVLPTCARDLPSASERSIKTLAKPSFSVATVACLCTIVTACVAPPAVTPSAPVADAKSLMRLGRYDEARQTLGNWLVDHPDDQLGLLALGAVFEGLGHTDSAQNLYIHLGSTGLPNRASRRVNGRMLALAREERLAYAKKAVAREQELSTQPPTPNTIAVFPFRYVGGREDLEPLARGIAHLIVSDLGRLRIRTLLERQQVQFIIDELKLGESDRVDTATAARSGRLIGAEHVIQGTLLSLTGDQRLDLSAAAVRTTTGEIAAIGSATNALDALFDMAKDVLRQILSRMNIQLTPAEVTLLLERPTSNLLAFLAFSEGLGDEDRGDYLSAARSYRRAAAIDPGFTEARQRASDAQDMNQAQDLTLTQMASLLDAPPVSAGFIADNLNHVMPSGMETSDDIQTSRGNKAPSGGDGRGEVGGGDRIVRTGRLGIRVKRPQ
ncbi:MAG: CsgG/HfaB family protein [Gemmatimonadales bacterium]